MLVNRMRPGLLLALWILLLANPALAVDGVLEINQTCAANTGCFSGDSAGYPVQIDGTAGRSYRLTSDLFVPDVNTHGIYVVSPAISIDLNGFEIIRSDCVGGSLGPCTPASGTGSGVAVLVPVSYSLEGVSVRNGSITGMGAHGVSLGKQSEARNLRVRWNRLDGIATLDASTITGNTLRENGAHGISALGGSTVTDNTASGNGANGIHLNDGCTIRANTIQANVSHGVEAGKNAIVIGNSASLNAGHGISVSSGSTLNDNTVSENFTDGISAAPGSTIVGNSVYYNSAHGITGGEGSTVKNNSANNNGGDGIEISGDGSSIRDNTMRSNGGYGLNITGSTENGYGENVFSGNVLGHVTGGTQLGQNLCGGTLVCP